MRLAFLAATFMALAGALSWTLNPVVAAEGDLWSVDRQNVNIRSGPSTNTEIVMTVNPGEKIVEIAAKGDWFFVEFPNHNKQGWIFGPLLAAPGAAKAAAAPAPSPPPEPEAPVASVAPAPAPAPAVSIAETTETPAPTDVATAEPANARTAVQPDTTTQAAAVPLDNEPAAVKSFRDTVAELNDRAVSVAGIDLFNDVRSTGGGGVQVLATDTWARVPEAGQSSYMNALFDRWQSVANGLGPLSLQIVDPSGEVMMEREGS